MIFIMESACSRCRVPLMIYPGSEDGPGASGDLFLELIRGKRLKVTALCKDTVACRERRDGNAVPEGPAVGPV